MKRLNDVKISIKLFAGFMSVLLLSAAVGAIALVKLSALNHNASELADDWLPSISVLGELKFDIANLRRVELAYLILNDNAEERMKNEREAVAVIELLKKHMSDYEPLISSADEKRIYPQFKDEITQYLARHDRMMELSKEHKMEEARLALFGETRQLYYQAYKNAGELMQANVTGGVEEAKQAHASYASSRIWITCVLVSAIALGLLMALGISRLIGKPLRDAAEKIVKAQADRDLSFQFDACGQDEVGKLCCGFNAFTRDVHEMVVSLAKNAEQIASASEEISANATQTANGSETQRDQVHQVATAMQEMSATVHEVSENSNKAAESARQASETARQGGAIVEDTLGRMREIADSVRETAHKVQELGNRSDQIGKIVGVIDDIADQTNLLALNAAIEAARAGEQGRGFAVVADEVRKLAERTTKATKEIADMIGKVQVETRAAVEKMQSGTQQVEKGVEVTARAGESLKEIIGQADHVGQMVTHIATAATQQSSATEQVNNNMEQINRLVAESAEGAQQSAQACEQLSSLALELQNVVSGFRLSQHGRSAGSSHAVRHVPADPSRARAAVASPTRPAVVRNHPHSEVGVG